MPWLRILGLSKCRPNFESPGGVSKLGRHFKSTPDMAPDQRMNIWEAHRNRPTDASHGHAIVHAHDCMLLAGRSAGRSFNWSERTAVRANCRAALSNPETCWQASLLLSSDCCSGASSHEKQAPRAPSTLRGRPRLVITGWC